MILEEVRCRERVIPADDRHRVIRLNRLICVLRVYLSAILIIYKIRIDMFLRSLSVPFFLPYNLVIGFSHINRHSQPVDLLTCECIKVVIHGQVVQDAAQLDNSLRLLVGQFLYLPVPVADVKPHYLVLIADILILRRLLQKKRELVLTWPLGHGLIPFERNADRFSTEQLALDHLSGRLTVLIFSLFFVICRGGQNIGIL